jgi:hypothetical protein
MFSLKKPLRGVFPIEKLQHSSSLVVPMVVIAVIFDETA